MTDAAFTQHQAVWAEIVESLVSHSGAKAVCERARRVLGLSIDLVHGAKARAVAPILAHEGLRLTSVAIRRLHCLCVSLEQALPESVLDQVRSLLELSFQAFYLVRATDRTTAALDAYNISALGWARKGDALVAQGHLSAGDMLPKSAEPRATVESQIFARYQGRRPKFYGDLSVTEVAKAAALDRQHAMLYSALSMVTHNEPFAEKDPVLRRHQEAIELALVPPRRLVEDMFAMASIGIAAGPIAALGGLALVADPAQDRTGAHLRELLLLCGPDWKAELETLAVEWGTTLNDGASAG